MHPFKMNLIAMFSIFHFRTEHIINFIKKFSHLSKCDTLRTSQRMFFNYISVIMIEKLFYVSLNKRFVTYQLFLSKHVQNF